MQQARKQLRKEEFLAIGPCVLSSRLLGRSGATAHYKYDLLRYRQIRPVKISAKTDCTPRTQDVSRTIAHAQNIPLGMGSQARRQAQSVPFGPIYVDTAVPEVPQ